MSGPTAQPIAPCTTWLSTMRAKETSPGPWQPSAGTAAASADGAEELGVMHSAARCMASAEGPEAADDGHDVPTDEL